VEHIEQVQRAMKDGVDVRGFLVWSLMDNFEWTNGFGPRFGLLRVDYKDPQRSFKSTRGAQAYSEIIHAGGVTPELAKKWDPKKK
jgi:beta-glucosidase/6-phospho-beta-glucosidase/beta-galactosidase